LGNEKRRLQPCELGRKRERGITRKQGGTGRENQSEKVEHQRLKKRNAGAGPEAGGILVLNQPSQKRSRKRDLRPPSLGVAGERSNTRDIAPVL